MSKTILGLIVALVLPVLVKLGFSEACAGEVTSILLPFLSAIPGIALAWWGRYRMGGINVIGTKK